MIIWLASYPRSGNTLTRILLHSIYGVKTHSMHADAPLAKPAIRDPLGLVINDKLRPLLAAFRERAPRYFIKTHAVLDGADSYIDEDDMAIYIVRDGRDALISRAHFFATKYSEFKDKFEDTLERLVRNEIRYRPWGPTVMTWADRPHTAYLHYEDMVRRPITAMKAAMETLGVKIPRRDVKIPKFTTLHKLDPVFFRKGKAGAWKKEMSASLQEVFWENNGEAMDHYGYTN